jgi:hypothetical protein
MKYQRLAKEFIEKEEVSNNDTNPADWIMDFAEYLDSLKQPTCEPLKEKEEFMQTKCSDGKCKDMGFGAVWACGKHSQPKEVSPSSVRTSDTGCQCHGGCNCGSTSGICIVTACKHCAPTKPSWDPTKPSWGERFDNEFCWFDEIDFINAYGTIAFKNDIKKFISDFLTTQREEIKREINRIYLKVYKLKGEKINKRSGYIHKHEILSLLEELLSKEEK